MSEELAAQIARRFIQNRATKAIQFSNGDYVPDFRMKDTQPEHGGSPATSRHGIGFSMENLEAHLAGRETYGHYLLDDASMARVFAFDIDLGDEGTYCIEPQGKPTGTTYAEENAAFDADVKTISDVNPRDIWLDRDPATAIPEAREWYKKQMMHLARKFVIGVTELGLPCAAAYSGSKGVHVYGFTGPMPAAEVRAAAELVMTQVDEFEAIRGLHFFRHKNLDAYSGYSNFSVEVFPKQTESKENGLGNLMRLPLGRNLKSADPTFFLDLKAPHSVMRPHPNPVQLLESGDPYA